MLGHRTCVRRLRRRQAFRHAGRGEKRFGAAGDLAKDKAIERFRAAGCPIDQTGGIRDGALVVDK